MFLRESKLNKKYYCTNNQFIILTYYDQREKCLGNAISL